MAGHPLWCDSKVCSIDEPRTIARLSAHRSRPRHGRSGRSAVGFWLEQPAGTDEPYMVVAATGTASATVNLGLAAAVDVASIAADLVHLARLASQPSPAR